MNQQYNSASCFACGLENPSGLRLRFYDNGKDQVFTQFILEFPTRRLSRHGAWRDRGSYPRRSGRAYGDDQQSQSLFRHRPHGCALTASRCRWAYRLRQPAGCSSACQPHPRPCRNFQSIGKDNLAEADILYTICRLPAQPDEDERNLAGGCMTEALLYACCSKRMNGGLKCSLCAVWLITNP